MLKQKILLMLLCCSPLFAFATPATDLASLLNAVHTMKADFIQKVYDNHGKVIQTSQGKMALDRPGKFRWQVTKPIPQLIIANQTRLWIYDSDLEQVTIRPLTQAAGDTPALLLSHVGTSLETDYAVKPLDKTGSSLTWFQLTPKNTENMFASVQMGFKQNEISEMRLEDHLGHITAITFTQTQTNVALPGAQFTFKAPAGVDVIDETLRR